VVNIAAYPAIEPAQEHARQLVKQKLRAGVRQQALPDRVTYVVVIEGFATEEAAETAAIDLEAHFDLDVY
ncbi:MAG: SPOR domain-containing protein, partial [Panacagrimonas sp.]